MGLLVVLPVLLDLGVGIGLLSRISCDPVCIGVAILASLVKVRVLVESGSDLVELLELLVSILSCSEVGATIVRMATATETAILA